MSSGTLNIIETSTPENPIYDRAALEQIFLPVDRMLQIDRVVRINGPLIVCETDVTGHWVFPLHFPNDPIFPGTMLIEAAGQAMAIWVWHAGVRGRPRLVKTEAKFEHPVLPTDDKITIMATVSLKRKSICIGNVEIFTANQKVAEVKATLVILAQLELGM